MFYHDGHIILFYIGKYPATDILHYLDKYNNILSIIVKQLTWVGNYNLYLYYILTYINLHSR